MSLVSQIFKVGVYVAIAVLIPYRIWTMIDKRDRRKIIKWLKKRIKKGRAQK